MNFLLVTICFFVIRSMLKVEWCWKVVRGVLNLA